MTGDHSKTYWGNDSLFDFELRFFFLVIISPPEHTVVLAMMMIILILAVDEGDCASVGVFCPCKCSQSRNIVCRTIRAAKFAGSRLLVFAATQLRVDNSGRCSLSVGY